MQRVEEGEEAKPGLQADARALVAAEARGAAAEHAVAKRVAELMGARDDLLVKIVTCATAPTTASVARAGFLCLTIMPS